MSKPQQRGPPPGQQQQQQQQQRPSSFEDGEDDEGSEYTDDDGPYSDEEGYDGLPPGQRGMQGLPQPGAPPPLTAMANKGGGGRGSGPPPAGQRGVLQPQGSDALVPEGEYDDDEGPYSDDGQRPYDDEEGMGGPPLGPGGPPPGPPRSQEGLLPKALRAASMAISLVGIILLLVFLIQDVTTYMNRNNDSASKPSASASKTTSTKKAKSTSAAASETLLGRALPVLLEPTHRIIRRSDLYRRAASTTAGTTTSATQAAQYVLNTDIPTRSAAVGFVVATHFFQAALLLAMIWIDFAIFKGKPSVLEPWDTAIVGLVQFLIAFDVLSRKVSTIIEKCSYVFLLLALLNLGWGVWFGIKGKKRQPFPDERSMYGDDAEGPYPNEGEEGEMGGPGGDDEIMMDEDPDGMPGTDLPPGAALGRPPGGPQGGAKGMSGERPDDDEDEKSMAPTDYTDDQSTVTDKYRKKSKPARQGGRGRKAPSIASSWVTQDTTDDADSYYARSISTRHRKREREPRRPDPAYDPRSRSRSRTDVRSDLPSPISLYDPKELLRKQEREKRARSRSLTRPAGPPPQATRFRDRIMTAVQEEEEEDDEPIYRQDATRGANDGFAQRAKDYRNLKRLSQQGR